MDNQRLIDNLKAIQGYTKSLYSDTQKNELIDVIKGYSDLINVYRENGGKQISPQFTSEWSDLIYKVEKDEFAKAREFFLDDLEKAIHVLEEGGYI